MNGFQVTPAHAAIFAAAADPDGGNLQISAVAGAGKTSTLVELMRRLQGRVMYLVFNKRNADEAASRVPANVRVFTLNAIGYRALLEHMRGLGITPRMNGRAVEDRTKALLSDAEFREFGGMVVKLVRLAKANGFIPDDAALPVPLQWARTSLCPPTVETLLQIMEVHDLDPDCEPVTVATSALSVLRSCLKHCDEEIDFDDQLLLSWALGAHFDAPDWTLVDEAQDLSRLQHCMVERISRRGRLIAVGDPHQAIYAFRGADASSMARMAEHFCMRQLPLHVSYRCPRAVVALAQRYVPHIQPHANAPDGVVVEQAVPASSVEMRPGDMVVCRNTAPVVRIAYGLLRAGTPVTVLGKDIGAGVLALVKKLRGGTLDGLRTKLADWQHKETTKAREKNDEAKVSSIEDKAETLRCFIAMSSSVDDLKARVEGMFAEANPASVVTCSTIHKAKGLEAERVFIADFHRMPSKHATKDWQLEQETNLIYVAVTRAKRHLQMVTAPGGDAIMTPLEGTARAETRQPARMVVVGGNTFPVKEELKALGARWDKAGGVWLVPENCAEEARNLVKNAGPARRRW